MFTFQPEQNIYRVLFGPHKVQFGELYREVDGYWVWWPDIHHAGYLTEQQMQPIVDKLTELNKPWYEQVCRDMDVMKISDKILEIIATEQEPME